MTESAYFEPEELNRKRSDFMTDTTLVELGDTPKLIELGEKLRTEDTSINAPMNYTNTPKRVRSYLLKSQKPASC